MLLQPIFGASGSPVGPNAVFDRHGTGEVFAEWRVNNPMLGVEGTVHEGQIFLFHSARLPDFT